MPDTKGLIFCDTKFIEFVVCEHIVYVNGADKDAFTELGKLIRHNSKITRKQMADG